MQITGAYNFRDLGGLPTRDGRRTTSDRLFRSDTLQQVTDTDVQALVGTLQIGAIVDLRGGRESVEQGRGRLSTVDAVYVNVPMLDAREFEGEPGDLLLNHYLRYLRADGNLALAVDLVLSLASRSPVVVHCAAGKDRTGMVVAIVLHLLGVRGDAIVADYVASQERMPQVTVRLAEWPRYRESMDRLPGEIYAATASTMQRFLQTLEERYGGARSWLVDRGVDKHTLDRAVQALVAS